MAKPEKNKNKIEVRYEDIAVAIKYVFGKEGEVPKVVASGRGYWAKQIVDLAKENNVPLKEDTDLAESLVKLPVGVEIPQELWAVVAEILAQVYKLDESKRT